MAQKCFSRFGAIGVLTAVCLAALAAAAPAADPKEIRDIRTAVQSIDALIKSQTPAPLTLEMSFRRTMPTATKWLTRTVYHYKELPTEDINLGIPKELIKVTRVTLEESSKTVAESQTWYFQDSQPLFYYGEQRNTEEPSNKRKDTLRLYFAGENLLRAITENGGERSLFDKKFPKELNDTALSAQETGTHFVMIFEEIDSL